MLYILLPAYNEEPSLEPLLSSIKREMEANGLDYRIVVVNDGSNDRTGELLAELSGRYPLHTITHRYNRGLGETARDGFEHIADIADPDDVIVRMDCDDTHDPAYIPEMLERLAEGAEVVIASRYQPGGGEVGLDLYRRTISRIANLMFKTVFPIRGVWEYTCGFRAYRVSVIQDALEIFGNKFIDLKGLGFTGTLEKLIKMRMIGARIVEIPFVLRYDKKMSSSKVVTSITTLGCFVLMIKHFRYWNEEGRRWKAAIAERLERRERERMQAPPPEGTASIERVRAFWEANPLYAGETSHAPGSREFFDDHDRVTLSEHSGRLSPIFFRDVTDTSRVLDVGCGIGFWTEQLSHRAGSIHACDLTGTAVDLTRRRMEQRGFAAEVSVGNAESLPYSDGAFDHINCQGVIHHTPDPAACIREFARVLRPNGTLCFSVYYRTFLLRHPRLLRLVLRLLGPLMRLPGRGREAIGQASSPEELVRMYDGAENPLGFALAKPEIEALVGDRFEVVEVVRSGFPRRALPLPIPSWAHRALSRSLGLMLVVRCRRVAKQSVPAATESIQARPQLVAT